MRRLVSNRFRIGIFLDSFLIVILWGSPVIDLFETKDSTQVARVVKWIFGGYTDKASPTEPFDSFAMVGDHCQQSEGIAYKIILVHRSAISSILPPIDDD